MRYFKPPADVDPQINHVDYPGYGTDDDDSTDDGDADDGEADEDEDRIPEELLLKYTSEAADLVPTPPESRGLTPRGRTDVYFHILSEVSIACFPFSDERTEMSSTMSDLPQSGRKANERLDLDTDV